MRIDNEVKLDFKDVLIKPKRSTLKSRSEVNLTRTFVHRYHNHSWTGIPIISSNMDSVGTFEMAVALSKYDISTAIHKFYSLENWLDFYKKNGDDIMKNLYVSSGASDYDLLALDKILSVIPCKQICLDVANGYSESFVESIRKTREKYPDHLIAAGNVVTGEMTEQLILSGADIVKVGIGPGSVCTTRKITGVGYPQLSAIIECADAAHGLKGLVIADGGCTCPGDVAKAFGAGADHVMIGGMFAGHEESNGEIIEEDGKQYKKFYGMSSESAMEKYYGSVADYRAPEGKMVKIPFRGSIDRTVQEILGGLRSTCTYVGAQSLKELSKRTTFIRVTQQINNIFT